MSGRTICRYPFAPGARLVRAFLEERLQPELGGASNGDALARLRRTVAAAHDAGLEVVLDLDDYGRKRIVRDAGRATRSWGIPDCRSRI